MTQVLISFSPAAVRFLTDTVLYDPTDNCAVGLCGPKAEISPAGRMAWAARGLTLHGDHADRVLHRARGIDAALEAAPALVKSMEAWGWPVSIEVFLAGWSDAAGALRLVRIVRDDRSRLPLTVTNMPPGIHVAGAPETLTKAIAAKGVVEADEALLVKLAGAQWRWNRDTAGGQFAIGGALHLTELTAAGCARWVAGTHPDYDDLAARFVCPIADEVAAHRAPMAVAA
ncbi:MAG: hypothetical protein RLY86_3285 [Pseudomonadota bacterium]|jgi:hypothetical protein